MSIARPHPPLLRHRSVTLRLLQIRKANQEHRFSLCTTEGTNDPNTLERGE